MTDNRITPVSGKIAIVTGGARGIGLAICQRLAADGFIVEMADVIDDVMHSAAQIARDGAKATGSRLDVSDETAVAAYIDELHRKHGRIDALVNNAGISPKNQGRKFMIEETTKENWQRVMDVNLTGPFLMTRACIPVMRAGGGGRIVNITSQSARTRPEATSGDYAASKAGLMGLSRALAGELGVDGITVNCVAPGVIETPMLNSFTLERRQSLLSRIPLNALGAPSDIAGAVSYLVSDDARYVTGLTIDVNGGMFMT